MWLLLVALLWSAAPAWAEVYICTQPDGALLFTDQPGPGCKPKSTETTPNRRPLYWCDGRVTFGDIRDAPLRDECEPLRAPPPLPSDKQIDQKKPKPSPSVTLDPRRQSVDDFLARYRAFLRCCVQGHDHDLEAADLEAEATALLEAMEATLSYSQLMTLSGRGIVIEVAAARDRLRAIKKLNQQRDDAQIRKESAGFDGIVREQRSIEDVESALEKLSHPPSSLERASTGSSIGTTPSSGLTIGTTGQSGDGIGRVVPRGEEIGYTPPTGEAIGRQPPRGPEIGHTPRTGPDIGSSSFNRPP